jgi:AcrR family transcriptional regulator
VPRDAGAEQALDLAAVIAPEEPARDGRVARGQRTRRSVAEALVELLRAGDPDPTAKAVAWRAGVSLRLVFHHFADMDDLYQFVAALQLRRQWADLPQLSTRLARPTRIERTVAHRAAHFEDIAPVRRALMSRAPTSPAVRRAIEAADALLLQDLQATFATELESLPSTSRADHIGAMDTCTSWEAWEHLRTASGLPVREARRVTTLMLTALCPVVAAGGASDASSASGTTVGVAPSSASAS